MKNKKIMEGGVKNSDSINSLQKKLQFRIIQLLMWNYLVYCEQIDFFFFLMTQICYIALIYAELSGDFPLGDSRQPIYKSLRPF
ncbi:hypothetical protein ABTE60_07275, partial [Acinetobacter baumannii]